LSHPLQGHTDNISMIEPNFVPDKIYVGTEDSKLWVYDMTTAGYTSNSQITRWFDLGQRCTISRVEVELPAGVAASDVLGLKVEVASGKSCTLSLSQTTLTSDRRTIAVFPLKPTLNGAQVRFTFTPSAGAPKFGAISLYGHPTRE